MTRKLIVAVGVLASALGTAHAADRADGPHRDPFMNPPPPESIYATGSHLGFSWRTTVIGWLGGVPLVREGDARTAEREQWWGKPVQQLPPAALRSPER
jgi:hypothetical protein